MITRGIKHDVERFINDLSAKYLPGVWKGEKKVIQVAVRPLQIWEVVFPETSKDVMLRTLFSGDKGITQHKKHNKYINIIRKILGVKKIPDFEEKGDVLPVYGENVEKVAIGIKEDYYKDGTEML